jgi:hypothetical protein
MLKNSGFAEAPCVFHVETHVETLLRLLSSGLEQAQPKYHISNDLKGATHWFFIRDTRQKVLGNERATMQKNKD